MVLYEIGPNVTNIIGHRISPSGVLLEEEGFRIPGSVITRGNLARRGSQYGFLTYHYIILPSPYYRLITPAAIFLQAQAEALTAIETPYFTFGSQGYPPTGMLMAGNQQNWLGAWSVNNQGIQYCSFSEGGVPGRIFEISSAVPVAAAGGKNDFLLLYKTNSFRATVIDNDGKMNPPDGVLLDSTINLTGSNLYPVAASFNNEFYLVIWSSHSTLASLIASNGVLMDSPPFLLSSSSSTQVWAFARGDQWIVYTRTGAEITRYTVERSGAGLKASRSGSILSPGGDAITELSINNEGFTLVGWPDSNTRQFTYQVVTPDLVASDISSIGPRKAAQAPLLLTGSKDGYAMVYQHLSDAGNRLHLRTFDSMGEFLSDFHFTNGLVQATAARAAASLGNQHLFVYSQSGSQQLLHLWLADSSSPFNRSNPRYLGKMSGRFGFVTVLPVAEGFYVLGEILTTSSPVTHFLPVGMDGSRRTEPYILPRSALFARAKNQVWGLSLSGGVLEFQRVGDTGFVGPVLSLSKPSSLKNLQLAGVSEKFFMTWEELLPAGNYLRVAFLIPGQTQYSPQNLHQITSSNSYKIFSSQEGFLILGRDSINAPANYPRARQYRFYLDAATGAVVSKITLPDAHIYDDPIAAAPGKDFFMVHSRSSNGFFVASQWMMPVRSPEVALDIIRADGTLRLNVIGDPSRFYLLETSTDLHSWADAFQVNTGVQVEPALDPGRFFRLRLIPN